MKSSIIFLSLVVVFFSACSTPNEPEISFEKPKAQVIKRPPPLKKNKGSLYARKGASLFADKKDLQIGDIIQVVIDESLTSDSSSKRELSNTRNDTLGGGIASPMATNEEGLNSTVQSAVDAVNKFGGVEFKTNSSNSFAGDSKSSADESFSTTISVIIEETYQNGNYYIRGSKEMLIDQQKQEIIIAGVIRPYDITSENTINSTQIANLKILYNKDGEEVDVLHEPWGTKLIKYIWPF